MKTLSNLEADYKKLDDDLLCFKIQSTDEFHRFSTEIENKLKNLSEDIIRLQIKVLMASTFSTIVITCIVQAIIKNLIN
jgi:hypothetical protein